MNLRSFALRLVAFGSLAFASNAWSACRDAVVLVHGNTGAPSDFDNTYNELRARG
jgi:triacylglycerol lipase